MGILLPRRTPFTQEELDLLKSCDTGLELARHLWEGNRFDKSMDVYDALALRHPGTSIEILAEAYERMATISSRSRYALYQSRLINFDIRPGDKVLDMGSGHLPFPKATHLADISTTDGSHGRGGKPFVNDNGLPTYDVRVEKTGFADKQFDYVYCSHVLEHAADPVAACRELMRIGRRGYIETPTKGKDTWMGSAEFSDHRWHLELVGNVLTFTEYDTHSAEGFGSNILMDMHCNPRTEREKAFSALIYLRADHCNIMFAWDESFKFTIRD